MVAFTDEEWALIEDAAAELGMTTEQAIEQFASDGLARRVRKKLGQRRSSVVRLQRR